MLGRMRGWRYGWAVGVVLVAGGCAETRMGESGPALYERLGGKPAIQAVVEAFVANVAQDRRINGRFANVDIPKLKGNLVDQVCQATGGPCQYRGRDMKTTHAGMRISTSDFDALVEDLRKAMDQLKVPAKEQQELLNLLSPMRPDIVEVP
jgi:hemoglobin